MAVNHACALPQGELGEEYVLYLLEDQEEQPVAVILPKDAAEQPLPATQEVLISIYCFNINAGFSCQRQGASADKLQYEATPCKLSRSKQDPTNLGHGARF